MTKSERMKPLILLSGSRERLAANKLAGSLKNLRKQEDRIKLLEKYLEEYALRLRKLCVNTVDAASYYSHHVFLDQLSRIITVERKKLVRAIDEHANVRQDWMTARLRSKTFNVIKENYHNDELREETRHEQKESDNLNQVDYGKKSRA